MVRTACALIYLISKPNLTGAIIATARPLAERSQSVCMARCRSCTRNRPPKSSLDVLDCFPQSCTAGVPRAELPITVMMVRVHHNVAVHRGHVHRK